MLRDWLNLRAQFLFNPVQIETVLIGHEINGEAEMSKASRSTNSVEICLRVLGEVKVDNDIDSLDIDAAGKEIGTDEVSADTIAEVMENAVAMRLQHLCMRIET
jgi:hypothetical protein